MEATPRNEKPNGQPEVELQILNERLSLAAKASDIGFWDWDLCTNAVYFSPEWKRQLGYAEDEIPGTYAEWENRLHPEDRDRAVATVRNFLEDPWTEYENEFRLQHRDGSYRWILARAEAYTDKSGKLSRMMGCHIDITERKELEHNLRESESEFRCLVQGVNSIILRVSMEGDIRFINEFGLDFFGYSKDEILGRSVLGTIVPERDSEGASLDTLIADILSHPDRYKTNENENVRKNGERMRVSWTNRAIRDQNGQCVEIFCVGNDVTDHRRADQERAQLLTAMEHAAEAILITDPDGTITYVNDAFERITGYSRAEALGENPRILSSGRQNCAFYEQMWTTLQNGQTWEGRLTNRRKDGSEYEEEATISPVLNAHGRIVNFVAVKRDVTEKLLLDRRLRQAQKLEAIGTLAGGIAHDFNNVLSAIIGYSEFAASELPEGSPLREDLDHVLSAAGRATELVRQILTFCRDTEKGRHALNPVPIIKEALKLLRPSFPSTIEINERLDADAASVMLDPTELHQVIMNLCTNAYHAMREKGGHLTIAAEAVSIGPEIDHFNPTLKPGKYVRITVGDTGCGMSQETMEHIFEPFFTTKPEGEGTGLGLATLYGIATAGGGDVTVYSEVGQGTTFHVYFPAIEADQPPIDEEPAALIGGNECILIVDDEIDLVNYTVATLNRLGYSAYGMSDSAAALTMLRSEHDRFDVLLTDLTMPKLTGIELALELTEWLPNLPIILRTGAIDGEIERKARASGIHAFLEKPSNVNQLAAVIRNVLDAHNGKRTVRQPKDR